MLSEATYHAHPSWGYAQLLHARAFRVLLAEPFTTASGKVLPLHVMRFNPGRRS